MLQRRMNAQPLLQLILPDLPFDHHAHASGDLHVPQPIHVSHITCMYNTSIPWTDHRLPHPGMCHSGLSVDCHNPAHHLNCAFSSGAPPVMSTVVMLLLLRIRRTQASAVFLSIISVLQ